MPDRMPEDLPDRMLEDMLEDMPDRMPEDMLEDMPDRIPNRMPDRMPEDLPDRMLEDMLEDMPDRMPEDMLEDMPDRIPNRMSEDMSDRMPEDVPVRTCINVMVGITRSKVFFCLRQQRMEQSFQDQGPVWKHKTLNWPCVFSSVPAGNHAWSGSAHICLWCCLDFQTLEVNEFWTPYTRVMSPVLEQVGACWSMLECLQAGSSQIANEL